MSDLQILKEMLADSSYFYPHSKNNDFILTLSEENTCDSSVTICNVPYDAMVIKADCFNSPIGFFKGNMGECKRADFVVISEEDKIIIYIELKKTKGRKYEIIQQLKGAFCLVKYCQVLVGEFWKAPKFLEGYKHRFISIAHSSISKHSRCFIDQPKIHDSPEDPMKISRAKTLQYSKLAGRNLKA